MKQSVIFSAILFIICSHSLIAGDSLTIIDKRVNFGYAVSQNRKVDAVIVHSTFNNSGGDFYDIDLILISYQVFYL